MEFSVSPSSLVLSLFAEAYVDVYAYYAPDNDNTYVSWYAEDPALLVFLPVGPEE